ncbi:5-amino-6-(D-ribitylamino)uracil--L-tyrosine 4-hydroxyphenyl transferase CofH [uncultured Cohaesibacter sp.]|uniref:5-amino-6-(D-ribitylamino)uracil--L-tyrosine 4-hydroxyphenyl transferase CofH n=1 Tax=uncultured Cohaesibacter sp. TaxID=1002546 RepID=UPI00292EA316|nr:5-amino-6-(D-ribitylamino)uracil--L-tyrosine 4-hydroxyphenyl transferase CofH [uncultured Cohaesibacter sp.]
MTDTFDIAPVPGPAPEATTTSPHVRAILDKALSGEEINQSEAVVLFKENGKADKTAIYHTADLLRQRAKGDLVTFAVNRNINFTNICYMGCKFCNFAKRAEDVDAVWHSVEEVVRRCHEAWDRGATEVCIQGGLHPKLPGSYYEDLCKAIKAELPDMHLHAFSPYEVWYGATKSRMPYRDFLQRLKDAGLGTMPGTAAEILDTEIRKQLTKDKLTTEKWIEIVRTAHEVGIKTTSTIMYGHIDAPEHWAAHIDLIRSIQKETGGFTEFVPLSFQHEGTELYTSYPGKVRKGPSLDEIDKMHAVARIMLHGWIDNIQVSWTKLGPAHAMAMLSRGANDLGGTLMEESISRSAGADHGQEITAYELVQIIRASGRVPAKRASDYRILETYEHHDPVPLAPLIDRAGADPLDFLEMVPVAAAKMEAAE